MFFLCGDLIELRLFQRAVFVSFCFQRLEGIFQPDDGRKKFLVLVRCLKSPGSISSSKLGTQTQIFLLRKRIRRPSDRATNPSPFPTPHSTPFLETSWKKVIQLSDRQYVYHLCFFFQLCYANDDMLFRE